MGESSYARATTQGVRLALALPPYALGLGFVALGGAAMAAAVVAISIFTAFALLAVAVGVVRESTPPVVGPLTYLLVAVIALVVVGVVPVAVIDLLGGLFELLATGIDVATRMLITGTVALGIILGVGVCLRGVYDAFTVGLRVEPAAMLARTGPPVTASERRAVATVRRLALQVDLPVPAVRILDSPHPICYTIRYPSSTAPESVVESSNYLDLEEVTPSDPPAPEGHSTSGPAALAGGSDAADPTGADHVVVVSTTLVDALPTEELEAVLAYEVAHVANGDLRLMNWLLLPIFWADATESTFIPIPKWSATPIRWTALPGVAFFNRGREFLADAAGARITGDPAALASALERLDEDAPTTPESDFRAVALVNVLPTRHRLGTAQSSLPRSHPPTEDRIDRLAAMEIEGS